MTDATPLTLRERLQLRCPAWLPTETQRRAIERFFQTHPDARDAYYFFDGRLVDGDTYRGRMTSRTAQLVAIATDGFPVNVSRRHADVASLHGRPPVSMK